MHKCTLKHLVAVTTFAAALSLSSLPVQAAEVTIGGFAGVFSKYDGTKNTLDFTMDEVKLVPIVNFSEDLELYSEFVYAFDRTQDPMTGAKGADIPLKMERLSFMFYNIAPSMNLQVGQMRIPFGFWDDLSAERKTAKIKNDKSIMGFKLRKRDMGISLYGDVLPDSLLSYRVGVFNGNGDNTFGDNDTAKDLIGRFGTKVGPVDLGFSTYYGTPFSSTISQYSLGMDYQIAVTNQFLVSGEACYSSNNNVKGKSYTTGNALGGYVQANYNLGSLMPGMRLFVMYDAYQKTTGSTAAALEGQYLGGFRYRFAPGVTGVMNVVYGDAQKETSLIGKVELTY